MSTSFKAYLLVGIKIHKLDKEVILKKFDEDTGKPVDKPEIKKIWVISGTDIEVKNKYEELENKSESVELFYDYSERDYKFVAVKISESPYDCGFSTVDVDLIGPAKALIVNYVREFHGIDIKPETYLVQYCG